MGRERREIINDENNMAEKRQFDSRLCQKDHLDEIFSLAAQHHQKGNYKDAENLYKQILEVNPTHYQSLGNLGLLAKQFNKYNISKGLLEKAIQTNPNFANAHYNLGNVYQGLGETQQAINCYQQAIQINPNFTNAHYNLGNTYQELGETQQAINCYQRVIQISPNHADTYHNLGVLMKQVGETQQAINYYQQAIALYDHVLISNPNDQRAHTSRQSTLHLLNSQVGVTTKTAPKHYIQSLFDDYAKRFDHHLTETLDYKVPQLLKNRLATQLGSNLTFDMAIDLGCGTGLSGEAFRPICRQLVGIDLSPKMIEKAEKKQVYDSIENGEINKYLERNSEKYDLFIATDLLIYVGDLTRLFSNVSKASKSKAIFLFSTESVKNIDYILTSEVRYAHSTDYINQLAKLHKFNILRVENTTIRKKVEGQLFILQRLE